MEEYKNYPEGSAGKKLYDKYHMPFETWIKKYYQDADLTGWNRFYKWVTKAFAKSALFESQWCKGRIERYDYDRLYSTYKSVSSLGFFDEEINRFIAFIASEGFFEIYNLSLDEWLHSKEWNHPSQKCEIHCYTIVEVSKLPFGINYIKSELAKLDFWELL